MSELVDSELMLSRHELAEAIQYWGQHGDGGDSLCLPKQARKLVDILATMDYHKEDQIKINTGSERGQLLLTWYNETCQHESNNHCTPTP